MVTQTRHCHRNALLIDLENIARGRDGAFLDRACVATILESVCRRAGDVQYILAVAPEFCVRKYGAELAKLGIRWGICQGTSDAADKMLCLVACDLAAIGFSKIVVSSGDHFFACLEEVVELVVIVPTTVSVSRELSRLAIRVAA